MAGLDEFEFPLTMHAQATAMVSLEYHDRGTRLHRGLLVRGEPGCHMKQIASEYGVPVTRSRITFE